MVFKDDVMVESTVESGFRDALDPISFMYLDFTMTVSLSQHATDNGGSLTSMFLAPNTRKSLQALRRKHCGQVRWTSMIPKQRRRHSGTLTRLGA